MNVRELTPDDCHLAFDAMNALRPHAGDREALVERLRRQFAQGYRLVGAFDGDAPHALSVAGFRFIENLAWGPHCYVDDLSTLPEARGRGAASELLRWIDAEAAREGIREVHLDSGVQPERQGAHRLYFAHGYRISSYHFSKPLEQEVGVVG